MFRRARRKIEPYRRTKWRTHHDTSGKWLASSIIDKYKTSG